MFGGGGLRDQTLDAECGVVQLSSTGKALEDGFRVDLTRELGVMPKIEGWEPNEDERANCANSHKKMAV